MKTPIPKSVPVGLHASSAIGNDIMSSSSPPGVMPSCFEVVLRNRIDAVVKPHLGKD